MDFPKAKNLMEALEMLDQNPIVGATKQSLVALPPRKIGDLYYDDILNPDAFKILDGKESEMIHTDGSYVEMLEDNIFILDVPSKTKRSSASSGLTTYIKKESYNVIVTPLVLRPDLRIILCDMGNDCIEIKHRIGKIVTDSNEGVTNIIQDQELYSRMYEYTTIKPAKQV